MTTTLIICGALILGIYFAFSYSMYKIGYSEGVNAQKQESNKLQRMAEQTGYMQGLYQGRKEAKQPRDSKGRFINQKV